MDYKTILDAADKAGKCIVDPFTLKHVEWGLENECDCELCKAIRAELKVSHAAN